MKGHQIWIPKIEYYKKMSSYAPIGPQRAEIESIIKTCLNVHCRVKFLCADLKFGILRLSTIKIGSHVLRSDHRELRNSKVKLHNLGGGGGGRQPCQLVVGVL